MGLWKDPYLTTSVGDRHAYGCTRQIISLEPDSADQYLCHPTVYCETWEHFHCLFRERFGSFNWIVDHYYYRYLGLFLKDIHELWLLVGGRSSARPVNADVSLLQTSTARDPTSTNNNSYGYFLTMFIWLAADVWRYVDYPIEDAFLHWKIHSIIASDQAWSPRIDVIQHHCMPALMGLSIHILPFPNINLSCLYIKCHWMRWNTVYYIMGPISLYPLPPSHRSYFDSTLVTNRRYN